MLDLQLIRDHPDRVRTAVQNKGLHDDALVDWVLALDTERRQTLTDLQEAQARSNTISKEIGTLMREGKKDEAQARIAETSALKERIKGLEDAAREVEDKLHRLLLDVPNLPHPSVPVGRTPADNEVVFESGAQPAFDFEPLPHWELTARHRLVDFERGAKVTGAGFPFYVGPGARLQRALINFFLDLAVDEGGYREMQPPIFVNADSATGTGQLPDKEGLMYKVLDSTADDLANTIRRAFKPDDFKELIQHDYDTPDIIRESSVSILFEHILQYFRDALASASSFYPIPTAEVPVTNYVRDEILEEVALPLKFCAYTPCFRREAGSHGKEVRGLNRLHQFDKVELVQVVHPDRSYEALEALRDDAERALTYLGLPYRRLLMCTGEMGFTQAKKYDLEVWSAGQNRWLEVSSISNFEAFQARRMGIRFRPEQGGKPAFVHTLNGSGLALPRVVAALLENNQQADGSIRIPEVLHPYTGFHQIG